MLIYFHTHRIVVFVLVFMGDAVSPYRLHIVVEIPKLLTEADRMIFE